MGWKNWSYAKKGALIGGVWGLLGVLFYLLLSDFSTKNSILGILILIITLPMTIGKILIYYTEMLIRSPAQIINVGGSNFISLVPNWLSLILSFIVVVALFWLIGLIYGKIKGKK